jgi:hypothetical protein
MLKCNLTRQQIREIGIMKGEVKVTQHTVGNNPSKRKFVGEARIVVLESRRVCMKGSVAVRVGTGPVSKRNGGKVAKEG